MLFDGPPRKRRESNSKETKARESKTWGRESIAKGPRKQVYRTAFYTRVFGTAQLVNEIHFAPPKNPWNDDSLVTTNKQWLQPWFRSGAKWIAPTVPSVVPLSVPFRRGFPPGGSGQELQRTLLQTSDRRPPKSSWSLAGGSKSQQPLLSLFPIFQALSGGSTSKSRCLVSMFPVGTPFWLGGGYV